MLEVALRTIVVGCVLGLGCCLSSTSLVVAADTTLQEHSVEGPFCKVEYQWQETARPVPPNGGAKHFCKAGSVVLSGGCELTNDASEIGIKSSHPIREFDGYGWSCQVPQFNSDNVTSSQLKVYVICGTPCKKEEPMK